MGHIQQSTDTGIHGQLCINNALVYAWAKVPHHFHEVRDMNGNIKISLMANYFPAT